MTDGGRAPSVLWGSVSPSVHWDTVYGLLPGSYVMTNVTEVCRCGWKPCLLGLPRWGLCVSPKLTSRLGNFAPETIWEYGDQI